MTLQYYDRKLPIHITFGNLPHWFQEHTVSFVTYRLDDSIPRSKAIEYKLMYEEFIKSNPKPWSRKTAIEFRKKGFSAIERWLHLDYGTCILRQPQIRQIIVESFEYLNKNLCQIFAYVIMPTHVHLMLIPFTDIKTIMESHKRFTATRINKLLNRTGHFWQTEQHDHLVRNMNSFVRLLYYIRDNPKFLPQTDYTLYFADGFYPDLLIGSPEG